jgi:hypothetical protein
MLEIVESTDSASGPDRTQKKTGAISPAIPFLSRLLVKMDSHLSIFALIGGGQSHIREGTEHAVCEHDRGAFGVGHDTSLVLL